MKNTPRIMIAEDERITAEDIKHHLEDFSYAISSIVSSGEDAIKKAMDGLETTAVKPSGKLATAWGKVKVEY